MRVTNKTVFDSMMLRLGNLTEAVSDGNLVVSTGKQINRLSDNPSGLSQVMKIKSSIGNIAQYDKNMDLAVTWLTGGESALSSINDLVLDMQLLSNQMANASNNANQRADAAETAAGVLEQIISLANTEVNGNYIFSGTRTNVNPFAVDDQSNPEEVRYQGDNIPFAVSSEKGASLSVGRDGSQVFWEDTLAVDDSNNRIEFVEDIGLGDSYKRVVAGIVPTGEYTASQLKTVVRNAMNEASAEQGFNITYDVSYDSENREFSIRANGESYTGYLDFQLLLNTDRPAGISNVRSPLEAEICIGDALADAGSGISAGDVVSFSLSSGGESVQVEFEVDADNDTTRSNFLSAVSDAVSTMEDVDLTIDDSRLDAVDNQVAITNGSGDPIWVTDLAVDNTSANLHPLAFDTGGGRFRTEPEVDVLNESALVFGTPSPLGTAPLMLAYQGEGNWTVVNDPGYDLPDVITGTADEIEIDLNKDLEADIRVSLAQPATTVGDYVQFDITPSLGDRSIGRDLGFRSEDASFETISSDNELTAIRRVVIDHTNNRIDFEEIDMTGASSGTLTATIPAGPEADGAYTDPDALAAAIKSAMEAASTTVPPVTYSVTYDEAASRFSIREDGSVLQQLNVLWDSGPNSAIRAGEALGYYGADHQTVIPVSDSAPVLFTIDNTNRWIDFEEVVGAVTTPNLSAAITTGTYTSPGDLAAEIETQMNAATANGVTYSVTYDSAARRFVIEDGGATLTELHLMWNSGSHAADSAAETLGFSSTADDDLAVTSYTSDTAVTLIRINDSNNRIDFEEIDLNGESSGQLTAIIPNRSYSSLSELAAAIEMAMEGQSSLDSSVDYQVSYDATNRLFVIKADSDGLGELRLLWGSGGNRSESAASALGFDATDDIMSLAASDMQAVHITIDDSNNRIDFQEVLNGAEGREVCELCATIPNGEYTDFASLAAAIENAMNGESLNFGHQIEYEVSYDTVRNRFTIKESGTDLDQLNLLWESGQNSASSAAGVLGFDVADDGAVSIESTKPAEWSIFNTLIEFKSYLEANDISGIERTLSRLQTHYKNFSSWMADTGIKSNQVEVKQKINTELTLSLEEQRATLEDADIIEAIMNLQKNELAYQAALSSSARIMQLSLVDYL